MFGNTQSNKAVKPIGVADSRYDLPVVGLLKPSVGAIHELSLPMVSYLNSVMLATP